MSRHPLPAVAAAILLLATSALAHAETINKTLDGKKLAIDIVGVDKVDIQPQAGLGDKVTVELTSADASLLEGFVFTGGETASISREGHLHLSFGVDHPKVLMWIKVPAGMPIDLKNSGSTDFDIGAVGGSIRAHMAGSGDVTAATVTDLDLSISGSSDVKVGELTGPADIRIAGSGDVKIGNATIPSLKIDVRGSGNVTLNNGEVGTLSASVAGSGDLKIHATVKDASLSAVGSGDIDVAKVTGSLSSSKAGSGSIHAGRS